MIQYRTIKKELKNIKNIEDAFLFVERFDFSNVETNNIIDCWKSRRL